MALTDLIAKILDEAKKEVVKTESDTAAQIEKMESENEKRIKERQKEIKTNTQDKKDAMLKKVKTLSNMQRRNLLLQTKQEAIESVLNKVVESVVNLPDNEYEKIIAALFEKSGQVPEAVFHAPKGKENQTINGMKQAKMAYKQGASKDIKGGFILVSDNMEIDNSIESLVKKELRPELELEISKVLF